MIVKNEEDNIERALISVKPAVDEMIVVDTGSTDRTKDIARALGAKVYDFKWTDNFSDVRNFSLSKASGKWILVLDADEAISPLDHEKLRRLVETHRDSMETQSPNLNQSHPSSLSAYSFMTRNYTNSVNIVGWLPNDKRYPSEETGTGWVRRGNPP